MPEEKRRNEAHGRSRLEERNVHGWSRSRGQVLRGIPFHCGNSPASSADSRLNLDVLVLEGGREGWRGDTSQLTAVLGDTLKKPKAPGHLLSAQRH